jgi:uncharacterized membrane protein
VAKKPEPTATTPSPPAIVGQGEFSRSFPGGDALARILMDEAKPSKTTLTYPPPEILAEYKALDQQVFDEIVGGIARQRDHRHLLEREATLASIARQNKADLVQNTCAILSIVVAGGLVLTQIILKQDIHWQFPSILVLAGVGGRPVATIIASVLLRFSGGKS